jgi:hypothetical protein
LEFRGTRSQDERAVIALSEVTFDAGVLAIWKKKGKTGEPDEDAVFQDFFPDGRRLTRAGGVRGEVLELGVELLRI